MKLLRRLFFNLWYYLKPPWDTGVSPPELIAFIQENPPGRALDLGCGTGTNVITLAQHGWNATGIDFSRRAIQIARNKAHQAGVRVNFQVDDVTRLEKVTGNFELILDMGCFHSLGLAERHAYLHNLERLLAPAGTYLLYVFFRRSEEAMGPGLVESDLVEISNHLSLVARQDGTERGIRRSAWLTYEKSLSFSTNGRKEKEIKDRASFR